MNKAYVYELDLLGILYSVTLDFNKSSYLSRITLYVEHVESKWYSSSSRPSSQTLCTFIFVVFWCHDEISIPCLCDQMWRSVRILQKLKLMLVMREGRIWLVSIHALYWTQHLRSMFAMWDSNYVLLALLPSCFHKPILDTAHCIVSPGSSKWSP